MGNSASVSKQPIPLILYRDIKKNIKKRKSIDTDANMYINKKTEKNLFQLNKEIYHLECENDEQKKREMESNNNKNDDKLKNGNEKMKENKNDTTESEQIVSVRVKVTNKDSICKQTMKHIDEADNNNINYNNTIEHNGLNTREGSNNHKKKGRIKKGNENNDEALYKENEKKEITLISNVDKKMHNKQNKKQNKEKKQKKQNKENTEKKENEFSYGFFYMEEKNKLKEKKKGGERRGGENNIEKKIQTKKKGTEKKVYINENNLDMFNNKKDLKKKEKTKEETNNLTKDKEIENEKEKREDLCNEQMEPFENITKNIHENKSDTTTFRCIELKSSDDDLGDTETGNIFNENKKRENLEKNDNTNNNYIEQMKKTNYEHINNDVKQNTMFLNILKEKKILKNILAFLNCNEILSFQKICSTVYIYVSDFLDYACLNVYNKFRKTYADFFIPFNCSYKYEYLYTERPSYRLDCILFARIKPRCAGFNNRFGYRYRNVYDKHKNKYFVYFNFNVLKNNQTRVVKIYKDISYNNGDDINVSHIIDNDIHLNDFICIPINLYNQIGTVDFESITFLPNVFNNYIRGKDDIEDQVWYSEKEYKTLISGEPVPSYESLSPHLKHVNTIYAGIDVTIVKSTYRAILPGKLGRRSYILWGNYFIIKEKTDPILIFLKREGLLHDYIYHNFYLRVGDALIFYLIKGGNSY